MLRQRGSTGIWRYSLALLTFLALGYADPFAAQWSSCPQSCDVTGPSPTNWTYYHDPQALNNCNQTTLMELNVFNDIDDPLTHFSMRACSVAGGTQASTLTKRGPFHYPVLQERQLLSPNASISNTTYINGTFTSATAPAVSVNKCANEAQAVAVSADVNILSWGSGNSSDSADASSVVAALEGFLQLDATCIQAKTAINVFARSGNTIAGLYIGSQITKSSISTLLSKFSDGKTADASQQTAMELCASQVIGPQVFGLYVDTTGGLSSVQKTLQSWNNATCLGGPDATAAWSGSSVSIIPGNAIPVVPTDQSVNGTGVATAAPGTASTSRKLFKRDTCTYTQAVSGDGCWSMSQRCGISLDDFETYNGGADFCNTLVVGEYACCSAGTLPDFSPQPQANGDCSTYTIQANDICSAIAAANTMTTDQIEARNTDTWGWMGCTDLLVGQVICLSTGTPPMPSALDGAVCGPQVPGTAQPADMSTLASLNPCLLNACCDIWGQCGITSDFCTADPASTGAPGTALPGTNGCISNCGTDIVAGDAPAEFFRVGYYESFSVSRPCLRMVPSDIPTDGSYTHVHYAFAGITSDYQVDISNSFEEFSEFTQTTGFKKVLSFGGWSFSTDEDSFPIFREGVTDANRQTFANSVVAFLNQYDLDGLDFDWEYPGAPDIPGIPPGSPSDGPNYLSFLQLVRDALPAGKTLSIAAPASYWYLKGFPIAAISEVVDYIIYMTYDLHGQWDYNNGFSDPGCPAGNCLRSHVNWTETLSAFSMITKAGVPTSKIMVGMAEYGRSFEMTTAGCYTEMCTYTGPASGATPGPCTNTSGYISNVEIEKILADPTRSAAQYSNDIGDIVVYDDIQWVSWMNPTTYASRRSEVQGMNFGGTSDWAIDLDTSYDGNGAAGDGSGVVVLSPSIYTEPDPAVACYPPCTFVFPPWQLPETTTLSADPITLTLSEMFPETTTLTDLNGVTSTVTQMIGTTTVTTITLPPLTTGQIEVWDITWTDTAQTTIFLTSSVVFPPAVFTLSPTTVTSGTTTTTLAGVLWTYSPGPYPDYTAPVFGVIPTPGPPPPGPPPGGTNGGGSVKPGPGDPGPACKPFEICGTPCITNCIPKPPCIGICGCIGLGCPSSSGGNGECIGEGCDPDEKSSCTSATTVSDCNVGCTVSANTNADTITTNCYTTSCFNSVAECEAEGTTSTTMTTVGCPAFAAYTPWYTSPDQTSMPFIGDGGLGGYILASGTFTYGTGLGGNIAPTPTDPENAPLPTVSANAALNPMCFRDDTSGVYQQFSQTDATAIIDAICADPALGSSNTVGYAEKASYYSSDINVIVKWADDQAGCSPMTSVPMGNNCKSTFADIILACDGDGTLDYGGGFVDDFTYGCVVWAVWADVESDDLQGTCSGSNAPACCQTANCACDCGEDGCSGSSPACCASGTCNFNYSCDCNEDGCSDSSPACCASGTCNFSKNKRGTVSSVIPQLPPGVEQRLPRVQRPRNSTHAAGFNATVANTVIFNVTTSDTLVNATTSDTPIAKRSAAATKWGQFISYFSF